MQATGSSETYLVNQKPLFPPEKKQFTGFSLCIIMPLIERESVHIYFLYIYVCVCWGVNVLWLNLTLIILKNVFLNEAMPTSIPCVLLPLGCNQTDDL